MRDVQARTIRPDGSVINFDGKSYDKTVASARSDAMLAKTFSLPAVEVGSIIEYRYREDMSYGYVFDSHWILSQDLFTRVAKFSLIPSQYFALTYSWPAGLPPGTEVPKKDHGKIVLETHDVPAFVTEDYMPPENELKIRVDFNYTSDPIAEADPAKYWKAFGKRSFRDVEDFIDERRAMEKAVAQIVQPEDTPAVKLRKIYARTQQIRNVTFERAKTAQERAQEGQKDAHNVKDVWERGYGNASDVTWLFLALVRAAGLSAQAVLVPTRDEYFFDQRRMNGSQLNSNLIVVSLDGKDLYLDPGIPHTPFGLLPWNETAVQALRLNKEGGDWVTTSLPSAAESRVYRKATLKLDGSGTLRGTLTLTYSGLEALWRRIQERNADDTDRKEYLENQIKADVPAGIEVALTNHPDWDSSDPQLVADFDLTIPGWAIPSGPRGLLPIGLFGASDAHVFEHAARVHPLYFSFPYEHQDDISIELPEGWQLTGVPADRASNINILGYSTAVQYEGRSAHISHKLTLGTLLVGAAYYSQVQSFFQAVRSADDQQLVLARSAAPARR